MLTVSKIKSKQQYGNLFFRVSNNQGVSSCWLQILDSSTPESRKYFITKASSFLSNNLSKILTEFVLKDNHLESMPSKEVELNVLFNEEPFVEGKVSFANLNKIGKGQYFDVHYPISQFDMELFSDLLYTVLN